MIPNGIVYLYCPGEIVTGGPEAIHQLADALSKIGREAYVVYYDPRSPAPPTKSGDRLIFPRPPKCTPEAYARYAVIATEVVVDQADNVFIASEIALASFPFFDNITRAIWWLSINNGLRSIDLIGGLDALRRMPVMHLCQSHYAELFLLQNGLTHLFRLFDYTPEAFSTPASHIVRGDAVAYNPKKGGELIDALKKLAPDIRWTPLVGMSSDEVRATLIQSRLYVDFGPHPGKDRIPREAALSRCCVLTNRKGSAGLFSDVPIPSRYKLDDSAENGTMLIQAIRYVLERYDECVSDFDFWRRCIRTERAEFELQVGRIFGG